MRFLLLDILTDDCEFRESDERMLSAYGGHRGLFHRCLGLENDFEDIVPGLSSHKMIKEIKRHTLERYYDGVLIGGSVVDVDQNSVIKPWQEEVFSFIRDAVEKRIPVIGFCGGHQYGARAITGLSSSVIRNPKGENFGTSPSVLTPAGRAHGLFVGCPPCPFFHWSHSCIVSRLPEESVVLASHPFSDYAAFQYKSFIGLQWHPELGTLHESNYGVSIMRDIAYSKKEGMIKSGFVKNEAGFNRLLSDIKPAPDSARIFENWITMVKNNFF